MRRLVNIQSRVSPGFISTAALLAALLINLVLGRWNTGQTVFRPLGEFISPAIAVWLASAMICLTYLIQRRQLWIGPMFTLSVFGMIMVIGMNN